MKTKAIFLDIDGVLNCDETTEKTPGGCVGISDLLCKRLRRLIKTAFSDSKAVIILTSSWKYLSPEDADYEYMLSILRGAGAESVDITTDPNNNSLRRGQGIIDYLASHDEIEQYVIIDDYYFDMTDPLRQRLVLTDERVGLTDEDVITAGEILKGNLLPTDYYKGLIKQRGYYR